MVGLTLDHARVRDFDKVLDFDYFIFDLVIFEPIGVYDDVFGDFK